MTATIDCPDHGRSRTAMVCKHVVASIDGQPVDGFEWGLDEEGDYQATCRPCGDSLAELTGDARDAFAREAGAVICHHCFVKAAAANGVIVE